MRYRALLILLAVTAALELAVRGPARALASGGAGDFASPYAAARAWTIGANPYDEGALAQILREQGRESDAQGRPLFTTSVYPPTTLAALAPLAVPPWRAARVLWTAALTGAAIAIVFAIVALTQVDGAPKLALTAGVLALAPLHTGISRGQPAVASIALIVWAVVWMHRERPAAAGLALGLATVLKPQLAMPFIAYALFTRHRRAALRSAAVVLMFLIVGAGWLTFHDVGWWRGWTGNLALETRSGEMSPTGPLASQMIDLRSLLAALHVPAATATSTMLAGLLGAGIVLVARGARDHVLVAAILAVWTLLLGYHRFYDATLLAVPVGWAIAAAHRRRAGRAPWLVLICAAPFLVPGAWMLELAAARGQIPETIASTWAFDAVILRHQNLALLAMFAVLARALVRRSESARED